MNITSLKRYFPYPNKQDQNLLWTCVSSAQFFVQAMETAGVTNYTQNTQCKHPKSGADAIVS